MATDVKLRPFRDYSEHDVINLYAHRSSEVNAGTLVKLETATGWKNSAEPTMTEGTMGATYGNTVSNRYAVTAKVVDCGSGDKPIGMTLWDVKETDENGEKLLYNPRKAAEMQAVISGQAVPIVTRGVFLYSGTDLNATHATQGPIAGEYIYAGVAGELHTTNSVGWGAGSAKVGQVLGGKDSNGHVLIRLDV